mmetsp:Transcript_45514/g.73182  ORF Transcript_45514/g.73182 Transcript_45514/m.73182 type:complete len:667 (+) Transcript_45514:216-2216(+)
MTDSALALLKNPDHLKAGKNTTLLSTLAKSTKMMTHEKVIWSDTVWKRNHRGSYQKRDLIITTSSLYNFKKGAYKTIKRKIHINRLAKIVLHLGSKECLVKVFHDYDYWYRVTNIQEMLQILSSRYKEVCGNSLQIEAVKTDLTEFITLKKDLTTNDKDEGNPPLPQKMAENKRTARKLVPKIEGWLTKCGYHIDKYLPRYFQLVENTLLYYSARFKGSVKLSRGVLGKIAHEEKEGIFKFTLTTPGKVLVLGAHDKERCNKWFKKLNDVLTEYKSSGASTPQQPRKSTRLADQRRIWNMASTASAESLGKHDPCEPPKHFYQGFILKEEPRTKNMRRRLFVLVDDTLNYFETELKGTIPLVSQESTVTATVESPSLPSVPAGFDFIQSGFKYRFTVGKADRLYKLAADTEQQLQAWINQIETACSTQGGDGTSAVDLMTEDLKEYINQEPPQGLVALVFTDVQSSTKLWENRKMEMAEAISLHDGILRGLLKKHKGYEVRTEGDAFFVVFGDVMDAFNWCFESQFQLLEAEWPARLLTFPAAAKEEPYWAGVRVRMGVHIGMPNSRRNPVHGRMEYFGPVVNEADRIADSGHGGQVICTKPVMEAIKKAVQEGRSLPQTATSRRRPILTTVNVASQPKTPAARSSQRHALISLDRHLCAREGNGE